MKKTFRKIHLWLSVPFGLIISIICLTGAALVFEREINDAINSHLYEIEPPENARALDIATIAHRVSEQVDDSLSIASIIIPAEKDRSYQVTFSNLRKRSLCVNQYTGEVLGWPESHPFFQTMRQLHRWLMDVPPKKGDKTAGKTIVGVSTLVMAIILLSGLVVWWPKNRKTLKHRLRVSCTKGWRRLWYDSHVALGFYSTLVLLVMALTGLTWSFGWYRTAVYGMFGADTQKQSHARADNNGKAGKTKAGKPQADYTAWDKAARNIAALYSGDYSSITIANGTAQVSKNGEGYLRHVDKLTFNTKDGLVESITTWGETPREAKLKGWFYAFHTGAWGGPITKVIYFIMALIGAILPLTGYYLWIKRMMARRKKNS